MQADTNKPTSNGLPRVTSQQTGDARKVSPPPHFRGEADAPCVKWDLIDAAALVCFDAGALGLGAYLGWLWGPDEWAWIGGGVARLVIVLPVVFIVARRWWKATPAEFGVRLPEPGSWRWFVKFALFLGAAYAAVGLCLVLIYRGEAARLSAGAMYWLRNAGVASWCFRALVVAPLAEELVFRGVLYGAIRRRLRAGPAVLLSAVVFAAMHPVWIAGLLLPWTQFLGGLIFAWSYERTRSLALPVLLHVVGNLGVLSMRLALAYRPGWAEAILG